MIGVKRAPVGACNGSSYQGYRLIASRREIEDALELSPEYIGDDNCRLMWDLQLDNGIAFGISDHGSPTRLWTLTWKEGDNVLESILEFFKERGLMVKQM